MLVGGDGPMTVGLDVTPGGRRELPAGRGGAPDDVGDLGERHLEDVVHDEGDPLGGGHGFEDDQHAHADGLVEGHAVGGVAACLVQRRGAAPGGVVGERLGEPLAGVSFAPHPRGGEVVQADPAGHPYKPGGR